MKNLEFISELKQSELKEINGGSELTEAIWFGIGATVGYFKRIGEIWSDGIEQGIFSK